MADQVLGASDPATIDTLKKVLLSWGPGFYDAEVNIDGIGFRPDGKSAATRIPAAYGHLGENFHTWTGGFGNVTYWNAYVANLQMHGNGNFNDERFNDPVKYPAAVRGGFFKLRHDPDRGDAEAGPAPLLPALAEGADAPAGQLRPARRRNVVRRSSTARANARSATCRRSTPTPGYNAHTPAEIVHRLLPGRPWADGGDRQHLVTPQLNGLWARSKRGFYHDGRFPTLLAVTTTTAVSNSVCRQVRRAIWSSSSRAASGTDGGDAAKCGAFASPRT